jgi:hypothetical protein
MGKNWRKLTANPGGLKTSTNVKSVSTTPCVGSGPPQEFQGIRKEIDQFPGNWKLPEGKTPKAVHQFWREGITLLILDAVLYQRQITNELPAKV